MKVIRIIKASRLTTDFSEPNFMVEVEHRKFGFHWKQCYMGHLTRFPKVYSWRKRFQWEWIEDVTMQNFLDDAVKSFEAAS